jgi:hypothetical protein
VHPGSKEFLGQFIVIGPHDFTDISGCSLVNECSNFWDVTELESHLFVSDSIISYLLPFDVENTSNSAVMEAFELFFISSREVPRFTSPQGSKGCIDIVFCSDVYVEKCLVSPIMDLAFSILVFTLVSSLSSVVISDPRYLKLWVNWTCWLFGRMRLVGRLPSAVTFFASFRELGKNMASIFDLVLLQPTCFCISSL